MRHQQFLSIGESESLVNRTLTKQDLNIIVYSWPVRYRVGPALFLNSRMWCVEFFLQKILAGRYNQPISFVDKVIHDVYIIVYSSPFWVAFVVIWPCIFNFLKAQLNISWKTTC